MLYSDSSSTASSPLPLRSFAATVVQFQPVSTLSQFSSSWSLTRQRSTCMQSVGNWFPHQGFVYHVRSSLTSDVMNTVARVIVYSRLDCCNSLLHGISAVLIYRNCRVQNAFGTVIDEAKKYDSILLSTTKLHWLPITSPIQGYKANILDTPFWTTTQLPCTTNQPQISTPNLHSVGTEIYLLHQTLVLLIPTFIIEFQSCWTSLMEQPSIERSVVH